MSTAVCQWPTAAVCENATTRTSECTTSKCTSGDPYRARLWRSKVLIMTNLLAFVKTEFRLRLECLWEVLLLIKLELPEAGSDQSMLSTYPMSVRVSEGSTSVDMTYPAHFEESVVPDSVGAGICIVDCDFRRINRPELLMLFRILSADKTQTLHFLIHVRHLRVLYARPGH